MSRRVVALGLMAAGLVLLAALTGELLWESHRTAQAQQRLQERVPEGPVADPARQSREGAPVVAVGVERGAALLKMTIPRFGAEWSWVVLEGTSEEILADGPGHYVGTPLPGASGNVAIAGHRAGHGDPFLEFDQLRAGDHMLLTQGETTWDYLIDTAPEIVDVSASWVLDPLQGRRLTLTTCWPRFGSEKRMFVRAHLVEVN